MTVISAQVYLILSICNLNIDNNIYILLIDLTFRTPPLCDSFLSRFSLAMDGVAVCAKYIKSGIYVIVKSMIIWRDSPVVSDKYCIFHPFVTLVVAEWSC